MFRFLGNREEKFIEIVKVLGNKNNRNNATEREKAYNDFMEILGGLVTNRVKKMGERSGYGMSEWDEYFNDAIVLSFDIIGELYRKYYKDGSFEKGKEKAMYGDFIMRFSNRNRGFSVSEYTTKQQISTPDTSAWNIRNHIKNAWATMKDKGMEPKNVEEVILAGADGVAVVQAVCGAKDIKKSARYIKDLIMQAEQKKGKINDVINGKC